MKRIYRIYDDAIGFKLFDPIWPNIVIGDISWPAVTFDVPDEIWEEFTHAEKAYKLACDKISKLETP